MIGQFQLSPTDKVEDFTGPKPGGQIGQFRLAPQDKIEDMPAAAPVTPPSAPQPDKGALNAAGQGVLQGASLGFWDELTSGIRSLVDTQQHTRGAPGLADTYRKNVGAARDEWRAAQEQHPIASAAGQLAGGVASAAIPGLGMASLGRGFAANAARGAGAGILSGAGQSEATDVGGVVSDAAKGGLVGAAAGGILGTAAEKVMGGAAARSDSRIVQGITGGRATAAGKAVYRNEDLVVETAKKFGLKPNAADPKALMDETRALLKTAGQEHGAAFNAIDSDSLGVRTADAKRAVKGVMNGLDSPSDAALKSQVERYLSVVEDRWGDAKRIPLKELNREIGKLEKVGFAGADLSPAAGKQLKRSLADALDNVLDSRLEEVKQFGANIRGSSMGSRPAFSGVADAAKAAEDLPQLNRDYRGLKLILRAAEDRSGLPEASKAAGGLRNAVSGAVDAGLLFTHPVAFVAKKAYDWGGPKLLATADNAMASLLTAKASGSITAQMIEDAIRNGVPRAIAQKIAGSMVSGASEP